MPLAVVSLLMHKRARAANIVETCVPVPFRVVGAVEKYPE